MLFMCVEMEASVPIPCFSISPMRSDSVRYPGGDVFPCKIPTSQRVELEVRVWRLGRRQVNLSNPFLLEKAPLGT